MSWFAIKHVLFIMFIITHINTYSAKKFNKSYSSNTAVHKKHGEVFNMTVFDNYRGKRNTDIDKTMRRNRFNLKNVGLFIAAHKYLAMDARFKSRQFMEERSFFRHFPVPRLKQLHYTLTEACGKGAFNCLDAIKLKANDFNRERTRANKFWPFIDELDLFRFRTTASYFMCAFTLQENPVMKSLYRNGLCLSGIHRNREMKESGVLIHDSRQDHVPYQCSKVFFCPDPCYGRRTNGQVKSRYPERDDEGNPCRGLRNKKCDWAQGENSDFQSLIRNRFNVTCECEKERPGFKWSSHFRMCVDRDECWETSGLCGPDTVCQNTVGGYECLCKRGKKRQAGKCVDIVVLKQAKHATSRVQKKKERPTLLNKLEILFGVTSASTHPAATWQLPVLLLIVLVAS